MRAQDWRLAPADVVASLYASEVRRWRDRLSWDTSTTWSRVEAARRAGAVPGLLISDAAGQVRGWSFHLLHGQTLQVGALVTDSPDATRAWIDALADTPEALAARDWMCFGWFASPGVSDMLRQAGLRVQHYHYLRHDSVVRSPTAPAPATIREWRATDLGEATTLLAAAYPGADAARPFASDGCHESWEAYGRQIVEADANGAFDVASSMVIANEDGRLDAAALMTRLAPTTAHVAQLVVRPERHGQGLGRSLLETVLGRVRSAGCTTTTLLVNERNRAAFALYRSAGFVDSAIFVSAAGARLVRRS